MNDITLQDLLNIWPEKNPGEPDMPDFCEGRPNVDGVIITTDFYSDMSVMEFEVVDNVYLWNIHVVLKENNPDHFISYGREYLSIGEKSRYIKLLRSKDAERIANGIQRHLDKCCGTTTNISKEADKIKKKAQDIAEYVWTISSLDPEETIDGMNRDDFQEAIRKIL